MTISRNGTQIYSGVVVTTFADTGLPADSSYTYEVTTTAQNGSSTGSATSGTGPASPTISATPNGASEIDLALGADPTATTMSILRDGTQIYSGVPIGTFADTGLAASSTHTYTVITRKRKRDRSDLSIFPSVPPTV